METVGVRRFRSGVWIWAGLAAAYFVTGKLGLKLAFVSPSATPIWAPSGISLAILLLVGNRAWPGVFIGAFLANITTAGSIPTCIGIASGNTLEAITGAWLVRRFANGREAFKTTQGVFRFAALSGVLSTVVSAAIGTTSLTATGYANWTSFGPIFLTWWLGDAMGDWLIAPSVVLWAADWKRRWKLSQVIEAIWLLASLVTISLIVFTGLAPPAGKTYPVEILCAPILLWASFRFGAREAVTCTLVLAGIAIWGTLRGLGPFATQSPNTSLLLLQVYTGVVGMMSVAVATNVWERKRLLGQLRQSERELEQRASDLEQFAYTANHDLREPIRTISLFAQLLAKQSAGRLGPEADGFLRRIVENVTRMETLMSGLLDYSRVAHSEHPPAVPVRLDEVVEAARSNLESLITENRAEVLHTGLPEVLGIRDQLVSLHQNLIANAIKYRSGDLPVINISAKRGAGEWVISVSDNGIGIAPQYQQQIFGLFKRLHGPAVEGSGLGLAISRQIIERHGGRIWVESEEGHGATFHFSIPFQSPADDFAIRPNGETPPPSHRIAATPPC